MRRGLFLLLLLAGCESSEDPTAPDPPDPPPVTRNWSYSTGTDQVSLRAWSYASNFSNGMTLFVRCREGAFQVYVNTGFITDSGRVRYRIDSTPQTIATWSESTDYRALFYSGNHRTFADQLAAGTELVFAAREFAGPEKTVTFKLPGLSEHLPKVKAMCP